MMWIARYKDLENYNNNWDDKLKKLKIKLKILTWKTYIVLLITLVDLDRVANQYIQANK
jgi:hypothetical protein